MEYTMENFKNGEFVIICRNEEDANTLMIMFEKENLKWTPSMSALGNSHWENYGENTYYRHTDSLYYGDIYSSGINYERISFQEFVDINKSNKEKVLKIIGVKVGEPFNIVGSSYSPYTFNNNYDLFDDDGDKRNDKIFDILWGRCKIEKIPKDPNTEIKKCIGLLSGSTVPIKSVIDCVRTSLAEILELKEQKSA